MKTKSKSKSKSKSEVEVEEDDVPLCLFEFGDLSVWACIEEAGSAVRVLRARRMVEDSRVTAASPTIEGQACGTASSSRCVVRALLIEDGAAKRECPRDGDAGFRGAVVREARTAFSNERRKAMISATFSSRPVAPVPCKVGGWPDWLQSNETPVCALCESTKIRPLLVQVGSNRRWAFDGDGCIYVFECRVHPASKAVVAQSL
ncbi:MAG: hypothetical protein IPK13_11475 [Deltaproteobacteria bacterium]|nr:hypothetical protein [Deltaproteobacteria bacterium]